MKVSGSVTKLRHDYDALNAAANRAKNHRNALSANIVRKNELRGQWLDLNGRLTGDAAQATMTAIPVKLAVSAEDTFADFKKVMNGADGELLGQVYQDVLKVPLGTGKSFEDVVAVMTSETQVGLDKIHEETRSNTKQATQMSVVWGIMAEQAGDLLAAWRSNMGMTSQEARHTTGVINTLSSEMSGEVSEISRTFTRMGPFSKESDMAPQDIATPGMAFKASGAGVEMVGIAMRNFTKVLSSGSVITKDQRGIFERLGLGPNALQK